VPQCLAGKTEQEKEEEQDSLLLFLLFVCACALEILSRVCIYACRMDLYFDEENLQRA
jgi:hypothetical protein